jgi:hypothetical protein
MRTIMENVNTIVRINGLIYIKATVAKTIRVLSPGIIHVNDIVDVINAQIAPASIKRKQVVRALADLLSEKRH